MKKHALYIILSMLFVCASCNKENNENVRIQMHTTMGNVEFILYDETPKHRDNFVSLVEECYYDSLLFHRVIPGFMVQAGDPDSKNAPAGVLLGEGGPDYRLNAEIRTPQLFHKRGALAAARESDDVNPAKMSSGSQFYIVWGEVYTPFRLQKLLNKMEENTGERIQLSDEQVTAYTSVGGVPYLDGEYTVFGEVTKGLEVIDAIQNVERDKYNRPMEDIRILKMEIIKKK